MFVDRDAELELLAQLHEEQRPKLVIVYGRRRVGKTALLKQFAENYGALYLLGRQESESDQLKRLSTIITEFFEDPTVQVNPFQSWDAVFTYLIERGSEIPIIFDEFPYLVQSNPSLPSILQDYWDNQFSSRNTFIILCGSSIRMMESLLGYESPLYGRRTAQILLEPLKFRDACLFFPNLTPVQKVQFYAVLGGTPAYLLEFDDTQDLETNIQQKMLPANTFLAQDVLFVLREELAEPRYYFSILHSIAKGNTRLGLIVDDTGLDKGTVTKYLSVLISLQIIERRVPITEEHPAKSRKGIYVLKENFVRFWFRFIFENSQYVEQGLFDKLMREKIAPELPSFIGYAFENICLDWVKATMGDYLFGRWWQRDQEIDIVGIDPERKRLVAGEVKWSDLTFNQARQFLRVLQKKVDQMEGNYEFVTYLIIARVLEGKDDLRQEGVLAFDLSDMLP